ncbi:unnamed protein product (macronuclear) [Paramecium tetraurelia]|uniref:Uncharacterized protein n=1 Tax=Paramecium tetraurelia TaxID=5888 RepID=A0BIZ7_PARTE|nr:uncharacterized protein GSPATT00004887001 [Paramecium tetraurelia]CAK58514.1 unnamed protein product [Paramecium tetraurelia]|eukprot:XP_001425912.1 hypothetical protein (macronuclear) [Paramecium tetraurelia strain d4-2]
MQFLSTVKLNQETDSNSKITTLENNINKIITEQDGLITQIKLFEGVQELINSLEQRIDDSENCGKVKSYNKNNSQLSHQIKLLESRMIEMDNQILNSKTQPRRPEILQIENSFKKNLNSVKQEVQQEYKNIYKEMNGLRCDLDYVINSQVKQKITNKIKTQNINLENNKLLLINLLELETFIEELDLYENQNTKRFLEELIACDSEKARSLNYQLAGTKRKYLSEIKKIEHKFKILADLVQVQSPQEKYTIQLNNQMNLIVQRLHKNIDMLLLKISEQLR